MSMDSKSSAELPDAHLKIDMQALESHDGETDHRSQMDDIRKMAVKLQESPKDAEKTDEMLFQ